MPRTRPATTAIVASKRTELAAVRAKTRLEGIVRTTTQQLAVAKTTITALAQQNDTLRHRVDELNAVVVVQTQQIATLRHEVAELKDMVTETTAAAKELTAALRAERGRREVAERDLATANEKMDEMLVLVRRLVAQRQQ